MINPSPMSEGEINARMGSILDFKDYKGTSNVTPTFSEVRDYIGLKPADATPSTGENEIFNRALDAYHTNKNGENSVQAPVLNIRQAHSTGDSALPSYTYYENSADYSGMRIGENILRGPLVDSPLPDSNNITPNSFEIDEFEMNLATNISLPSSNPSQSEFSVTSPFDVQSFVNPPSDYSANSIIDQFGDPADPSYEYGFSESHY